MRKKLKECHFPQTRCPPRPESGEPASGRRHEHQDRRLWLLQLLVTQLSAEHLVIMQKYLVTSLPYFGVKLSCVCLMFAYRKK